MKTTIKYGYKIEFTQGSYNGVIENNTLYTKKETAEKAMLKTMRNMKYALIRNAQILFITVIKP